jgi:hypothetical protein
MDLSSEHIVLQSEADIIELESAVRAKISSNSYQEQTVEILITYVKYPKLLVAHGFLPSWWATSTWIEDYIDGMSFEGIKFWYNVQDPEELLQATNWSYSTVAYYKQRGVENAESLPLLLYSVDLVYKLSRRPRNDMLMFRSPTSPVITSDNLRSDELGNLTVHFSDSFWNVIRVTRYTAGMKQGLYRSASPENKFCGTFYYNEVESTAFLSYKTKRVYRSKYQAIFDLDDDLKISKEHGIDFDKFNQLAKGYLTKKGIGNLVMRTKTNFRTPRRIVGSKASARNVEEVKIPDDLILNAVDTQKILYPNNVQKILEAKLVPKDEKKYVGSELDLYALEDDLDQPLCIAARMKGIDIVVLTNMVGSHQIVVEVMDSRSRKESFDSLIWG